MPPHPSLFPIFDPASPYAASIARLFILVLWVCAGVFSVVLFLVVAGLARSKGRPGQADPAPTFGNKALEAVWTLLPLFIVTSLTVLTAMAMGASDPPAGRQPDLVVTAHQWWWEAGYPSEGFTTANEIHIPAGRPLLVELDASDVIHDFWVPRLGPKRDMIPGYPNLIRLEADEPGAYAGSCAEFCGAQHAHMAFTVVAQSPADYQSWVEGQIKAQPRPKTPSARMGRTLFASMTCVNCHALRGTSFSRDEGPDLSHLSSRGELAAGVLSNTPGHLVAWLEDPQALKPACRMPDFHLTPGQARDLATYLGEKP